MKLKNGKRKLNKIKYIYIYKINKYTYDFQQYENIRLFGDSIYTGKINIDEADMDDSYLLENIVKFNNNNKSRPRSKEDKK